MAYLSSTKIFCKFESTTVTDEVTGSPLTANGDLPSLATGAFGSAIRLSPDFYLSTSQSLSLSTAMTIGFWLKSVHPGMADSGSAVVPLKMAIVSKANFSYNAGTGVTSVTGGQFVVWEETQDDGRNKLYVSVIGTTTATGASDPYEVGEFHHFWIVFSAASGGSLRVFIDGEESGVNVSGTFPATLSATATSLCVNDTVAGDRYNVSRNSGLLDELVVFNSAIDDAESVSRAMTLGVEYVADTALVDYDEVYFGAVSDDTATVQVNAVLGDNADFYVGRSDGKVLRAFRSVWAHRRSFAGGSEKRLLEKAYGDKVTVSGGVLTPRTTIRS